MKERFFTYGVSDYIEVSDPFKRFKDRCTGCPSKTAFPRTPTIGLTGTYDKYLRRASKRKQTSDSGIVSESSAKRAWLSAMTTRTLKALSPNMLNSGELNRNYFANVLKEHKKVAIKLGWIKMPVHKKKKDKKRPKK